MAKSWIDHLRWRLSTRRKFGRRRREGWLGRIDGVEKPALLVGFGMLLYRAWKAGEPGTKPGSRWRGVLRRLRRRIEQLSRDAGVTPPPPPPSAQEQVPERATRSAQRGEREEEARLRHPPP